ncbi:MAG: ArsR/SmtB family transcription factor [Thermoprotei archaeon]|nr:winged helix-turn-helix domain-containing protein [TACK group archaeon]
MADFSSTEHMYFWIFVGSRGGRMRLCIMRKLMERPANVNQLAKELNVNYRTVLHHLEILEKNGLIRSEGPRYGALYFVSDIVDANSDWFKNVLGKLNEASGDSR